MLSTFPRLILCAALLLLAACDRGSGGGGSAGAEPPTNLRVYRVPAERAESLRVALDSALDGRGRVSLAPPDRLIVVAPVLLQTSVAENLGGLIDSAAEEPAGEGGPVRLSAWVVDVAEEGETDPRLLPLKDTLDALKGTLAAPAFALHGQVAVTANVDGRGGRQSAGDAQVGIEARLAPAKDGVHADITLRAGTMMVDTRARLRFGETVVLAQAMPEEQGRSRIRLLVVRADPAG